MIILYKIGCGSMAAEIEKVAKEMGGVYVLDWDDPRRVIRPDAVVIDVGSGRLTRKALDWCDATGIPYILAASGLDKFLKGTTARIVHAPNLAMPAVKFFEDLPRKVEEFAAQGFKPVKIYESHQTKKPRNGSGTARKIADICELPYSAIYPIRNPLWQRKLGVPEEYLDGHAYHWVVFRDAAGRTRILSLKIHGRREYAEGAIEGARRIVKRGPANLKRRTYTFSEVLAM